MPLHDAHYKHWDGGHESLWHRRWIIAQNGVATALRHKMMRYTVAGCWMLALSGAGVLFLVGQLLVQDSMLDKWIHGLNGPMQQVAAFLKTWLVEHPEISVRTTEAILLYYLSWILLPISIFVLGVSVSGLITRDLASRAIIIYSAKAVTRGDYLLGKFAAAFGLLALTWLGPVCAAWFFGNLLAPDWKFFWHSRAALGNAVVFALSGMTVLSLLALGVSSISAKEKTTAAVWFAWWVFGGGIAGMALHTKPWLAHISFAYNLRQLELGIFHLGEDIRTAETSIPILGELLRNVRSDTLAALNAPPIFSSVSVLCAMLAAAVFIIAKRVKPQ